MKDEARLKIHETIRPDGGIDSVFLEQRGDTLALWLGEVGVDRPGTRLPLPDGALEAVVARYGAPLDPEVELIEVASLRTSDQARLRHVRHLARYDVIARDFLILERDDGGEPLCALATTLAGALEHLGRASLR